jgi:hypothetical protein
MEIDTNHLYFELTSKVRKLFQPLFKYTDLNHFDYQRQYFDGTAVLLLGKSLQFVEEYFKRGL